MEKDETATRLGSARYHFGVYDKNTGHIHPMKLLVGLARAAQACRREDPRNDARRRRSTRPAAR